MQIKKELRILTLFLGVAYGVLAEAQVSGSPSGQSPTRSPSGQISQTQQSTTQQPLPQQQPVGTGYGVGTGAGSVNATGTTTNTTGTTTNTTATTTNTLPGDARNSATGDTSTFGQFPPGNVNTVNPMDPINNRAMAPNTASGTIQTNPTF